MIDSQVKKKIFGVSYSSFFFSLSLLPSSFYLVSFHIILLMVGPPSKSQTCTITICALFDSIFLICFYIVFFFLFSSRLVEGFYQINPLGLATFIFQFVFSRLELLPHCNASRQSIPFETSCL